MKAVSDKIPCHKMSHNVEGVALGGEYMGHHFLEGHDDSQYHPAHMLLTIVFLLTLVSTTVLMSILIKLLNGRNN